MPTAPKKSELNSMVEAAEKLLADIETNIADGNESETDILSLKYEEELEKVFSFKSQTPDCLVTKLNFSKKVLIVDHPIEALVERAFTSLADDIELIFSS